VTAIPWRSSSKGQPVTVASPVTATPKKKDSSKKTQPVTAKSSKKSVPKVKAPLPATENPLVKVEARLRKMGVWKDAVQAQDQLDGLDSDLKSGILLPSYLWKEFAIENRLPGFEVAVQNRSAAVSNDPNHTPSKHAKIQAFASSNAGPRLRQASSKVLTNLEETPTTQVQAPEPSKVPQSSGKEKRQVGETLARENPPLSYSSVARLSPLQERKDGTTPPRPTETSPRYPRGYQGSLPFSGRGRGGDRASGRKSGGRS
jgi:hypothetical protein